MVRRRGSSSQSTSPSVPCQSDSAGQQAGRRCDKNDNVEWAGARACLGRSEGYEECLRGGEK